MNSASNSVLGVMKCQTIFWICVSKPGSAVSPGWKKRKKNKVSWLFLASQNAAGCEVCLGHVYELDPYVFRFDA
jgi:hypothetical protein